MKPVTFYYDFLSPYSYLATKQIEAVPEYAAMDLRYRPAVLGTILSRRGVKGPGEIASRRRIGLEDLLLLGRLYDVPVQGPPMHPFNSVMAMRSVCDLESEEDRRRLTVAYFDAAWAEGRDLADDDVMRACLERLGIDQDPSEAASKRENRQELKANTRALMEAGGWGVPSFVVDDLVFFGHDRLPLLRAYLGGEVELDRELLADMLARPQPGRIE